MGRWGWVASPRREKTAIRAQTVVLCSQQTTGMYTNHRIDRDGHWQQFGTQPILISAPQWASWSCNAPTGFYRVGKKPSVKADQAIYSQRCMSESLRLGHNLDFSSCDIMVGFHKSSHIYVNDLPQCVESSTVFLFTDDAKCHRDINGPEDCQLLQRDLDRLYEWSSSTSNYLYFNVLKCLQLSFNSSLTTSYHIDSNLLSPAKSHRDLGNILSSYLSWNNHLHHCQGL